MSEAEYRTALTQAHLVAEMASHINGELLADAIQEAEHTDASIDDSWRSWEAEQFRSALEHPIAQQGFGFDKAAMDWADTCVLVLPSGRSAHLEAGYMAGEGKRVIVWTNEPIEPELMYLLLGPIVVGAELIPDLERSL